jgi:hypothetical protein
MEEKKEMVEIWKDIAGYEGLYQVSNFGRVKSLNYRKTGKEAILKLRVAHKRHNYMDVALTKRGITKRHKVHRLVAVAFIPNPNNLPHINHIDCDVTNNLVDNLEWCDAKYNVNYGGRAVKFGKKVGHRVAQCDSFGNVVNTFYSIRAAARELNLANTNIVAAIQGKQKTCGGFIWKKI